MQVIGVNSRLKMLNSSAAIGQPSAFVRYQKYIECCTFPSLSYVNRIITSTTNSSGGLFNNEPLSLSLISSKHSHFFVTYIEVYTERLKNARITCHGRVNHTKKTVGFGRTKLHCLKLVPPMWEKSIHLA